MKIALLGYGKMGREVEKTAVQHGHSIELIIDNETDWNKKGSLLKKCDVAIDFSQPHTVEDNIKSCFEAGVPSVVGTTAWYDKFQQIADLCIQQEGTLFYASNFSIGVNIFFDINKKLASLLKNYPMYVPSITEIHHIQKLDAPSGTAITLANGIIESNSHFEKFTQYNPLSTEIPIQSIREGNVTGTHSVTWNSEIDHITITHEAKNRSGFALGAIMASEWVKGKKGIFTMSDMLNI